MYFWKRIKPFFLLFIISQTFMRCIFIVKEWAHIDSVGGAAKALAIGFIFDISVFSYFMIAVMVYLLLLPVKCHGTRLDRVAGGTLFGLLAYAMLFTSVSEWFFWDEFSARFNFIAVDYLIYTHEVIGNIKESYPVYPLLAIIALIASALGLVYYRLPIPAFRPALLLRALAFSSCIALAFAVFYSTHVNWAEGSGNRFQDEISKNGIYALFSAYRHNELDYAQFYKTLEDSTGLISRLRGEIDSEKQNFTGDGISHRVEVAEPEQHYNIVLVTVESLSASFLGAFGNKEEITPYLDKLARESLLFTSLYAIGTRTVYGLSALTLSIPPLPGNSIIRRPGNERLFSLGSVLNSKGYTSKFIYGGYGYFDNMNYFFENNGYEIIDRASMGKDEVTFGNIWGVADEDLFRRTIKENDKAYAEGKPFFDMVMTTSNHRPFTYPGGKIDIPSHSGRKGGVKYTDYAIKQLIEGSRPKPWFKNTIFVIVADHTAGGAGKSELDPSAYHIPMLIYAPGIVKPGKMEKMMSQIDVPPTLLGLLNMDYDSRFYGHDVLRFPIERAMISNYQQLGYLTKDNLLVIKPVKQVSDFMRVNGAFIARAHPDPELEKTAISYFQNANNWKEWNKQINYSTKLAARAKPYENIAH